MHLGYIRTTNWLCVEIQKGYESKINICQMQYFLLIVIEQNNIWNTSWIPLTKHPGPWTQAMFFIVFTWYVIFCVRFNSRHDRGVKLTLLLLHTSRICCYINFASRHPTASGAPNILQTHADPTCIIAGTSTGAWFSMPHVPTAICHVLKPRFTSTSTSTHLMACYRRSPNVIHCMLHACSALFRQDHSYGVAT